MQQNNVQENVMKRALGGKLSVLVTRAKGHKVVITHNPLENVIGIGTFRGNMAMALTFFTI